MPPFRTSRRIEFAYTDMAGIVHFSNFFRFTEAAEVSFLHAKGLSVALGWEGERLGFPRVSATCDYHQPARFEDVIDIDVTLEKLGSKSVTYTFEFTRAGELIARGRVTSVCCRVLAEHRLEPMEIPCGLRAILLGTG